MSEEAKNSIAAAIVLMLLMGGGGAACVSCLDLGEDKKEDARTKTAYFGFDTEKTQPAVPAAIPFDTLEDPEAFTDSTEKTLELFRELMDFRSDPDFHRMGFGRRDNEYGRWLTRVEALNSSELVEREIQWYVIHPCYQLAAQNLGLSLEDATRIFKSELDFVASDADSGGTRAIRSGNHLRICRERMQRIHAAGIAREHG